MQHHSQTRAAPRTSIQNQQMASLFFDLQGGPSLFPENAAQFFFSPGGLAVFWHRYRSAHL